MSRSSLQLREALDADCPALTALCLRAKASWGYDAAFLARCREALSLTPAKLRCWIVRVAESPRGDLLGVAASGPSSDRQPNEAELELLFVEPTAMRAGVGRALLDDLSRILEGRGVEALWILSDPGAEGFYRRQGAVRAGLRPSDAIAGRRLPWLRLALGQTAPQLATARLWLRPWRDQDLAPFAAINADERVARYLPATLEREQSDALARRIRDGFERHGFGLWAAERRDDPRRPFIGFIGLSVPAFEAPFTPCVEIGWRLAPEHWGCGLATEGARVVADFALAGRGGRLRLDEIVSFTVPANVASRRVMEKIGMSRDPREDFDHPALPAGHRLRRHVLYRLPGGAQAR